MRLATKLIIMSFFTILIPILIIVFFSAFLIYQSNAITQWEYLENIQHNIIEKINRTEADYLSTIKPTAGRNLVRDKLYVYGKYWERLTPSLRAYDLESLTSFIKITADINDIETIVVYRRSGDEFYPVTATGAEDNSYLPIVLYKEIVQRSYSKIIYKRYPDGIYLEIIYPVFSDGKLVGLLQFIRSFNNKFMQSYADIYGIDYMLMSRNVVMFNSEETTTDALQKTLTDSQTRERCSFKSGRATYLAVSLPFSLGGNADGNLLLYLERANIFGDDSSLLQRMLAITVLCILIPVVSFFFKEIRLIRYINSLLAATDAISAGDYSVRVESRNRDELGMLSRNFNQMVNVLKKNREDLETQNRELSLKNTYIDAVFQSLRINIIVLDQQMNIQVINRNAESQLEFNTEYIGCQFFNIQPFSSEKRLLQKTLEEVYREKHFLRLYSVKFGNNSFEMDFYPVIEDDRSISAVVIVMNNITERMNMELALIQSDKLASVGKMAAGLAHEINNPMSIILNHVQLLQTDKLTAEEKARFIGRVETEIKRVSKLISNLLKFSSDERHQPERLGLGDIFIEMIGLFDPKAKLETVSEFYNGTAIVSEQAGLCHMFFREKPIAFYISSDLVKQELITGRDSLKQVLFNIIKNSFESIGEHDGIVWAGMKKVPEGTAFFLADNGRGISPDGLKKVFELFYTVGKPESGVGLGLPLCKKLMNSLGGEIDIESSPGRGTTVTLYFPGREDFYG